MPANTNWLEVARARDLKIPDDAIALIAPSLDALHAQFRALLADLPHTIEPAIALSEGSVLGR